MSRERYIPGDNWIIDDITGQKIRALESRRQWDGTITNERNYSPRHPQDFVRAIPDRQAADLIRSRPADTFQGPLTTETIQASDPGSILLRVSTNAGMHSGDSLSIILSNGDTFLASIISTYAADYLLTETGDRILLEDGSGYVLWEDATDNLTAVTIDRELPYGVLTGARIVDNTAMTAATLP